jgi:hypothetical protein
LQVVAVVEVTIPTTVQVEEAVVVQFCKEISL